MKCKLVIWVLVTSFAFTVFTSNVVFLYHRIVVVLFCRLSLFIFHFLSAQLFVWLSICLFIWFLIWQLLRSYWQFILVLFNRVWCEKYVKSKEENNLFLFPLFCCWCISNDPTYSRWSTQIWSFKIYVIANSWGYLLYHGKQWKFLGKYLYMATYKLLN